MANTNDALRAAPSMERPGQCCYSERGLKGRPKSVGARLLQLLTLCVLVGLPLRADLIGLAGNGTVLGVDPLPVGTLWSNGDPNGSFSFGNLNNAVGDQVFYNMFDVTGTWDVGMVWADETFQNGRPLSTNASWRILSSNLDGTPGAVVASGDSPADLVPSGFTLETLSGASLPEYMVEVPVEVRLNPGTYFLAVYPDNTNNGAAYTETTSGDGSQGVPPGVGTTFFSLDNGSTFSIARYPPCGTSPGYHDCTSLAGTVADTAAGVAGSVVTDSVGDPPGDPVTEPSGLTAVGGILLFGLLGISRSSQWLSVN